MIDDAEAIEKCVNGDREAFRFLVERYQRQAVAHATAILGNAEDARDATQEAFVDAFQSLERFDRARRFYPWFYVLLRNRCFKMAARKRATENVEAMEIFAVGEAVSLEEKLTLEKAMSNLSGEEREIIALKYLDGLSYEELAEYLQIPRGTVMSRLFYARKKLQAKLSAKFR